VILGSTCFRVKDVEYLQPSLLILCILLTRLRS